MIVGLVGCTKNNPDVCCATALQCDALGVTDLRPCAAGQACQDFRCIAAECLTNADCDAASPICSHGLCTGTCSDDTDCMGVVDRPHCTVAGACVGCVLDAQCPASQAICDATSQTCRGCDRDDECASGVCIEADGTCAEASGIVYVSSGGHDTGTCTKTAPCETFGFALALVSAVRPVIRILSAGYGVGTSTVVDKRVIIDGAAGVSFALGIPSALDVRGPGSLTIDTVRITGNTPANTKSIVATGASLVRLVGVQLDHVAVEVTNGALELTHAKASASPMSCTNGSFTTTDSSYDYGGLQFSSCQLTARRNRWDPADSAIDGSGGLAIIENNVFVVPSEFSDLVHAFALTPGSRFAFNTIVNTSSVQMSPVAISCDASLDVTSNIIAYNSSDPLFSGCAAHDSLFDRPGAPDAAGNALGDSASFFVDKAGGDFHLSATSPARGIGQAGVVTSDIDGASRPQPQGSRPDVGAYEAP